MNRAELIDHISQEAELTKHAAQRALEALFGVVTRSLSEGNPVFVKDFGTFTVKDRAARTGRNPQTGKEIKIEATKVVGFKAGKSLKEAVKEGIKEEVK